MDYEKKYKEALENARQEYNTTENVERKQWLEELFPELKESEDDKIRKGIKSVLKHYKESGEIVCPYPFVSIDEAIAWLENQQKPIINVPPREVILAIWDLGNEWKELTNGSISTEHGTQLDYIQKHWHESEYYLQKKQGEQKSAVEPKFKVGDWVAYNHNPNLPPRKIIQITNEHYIFNNGSFETKALEADWHLWTIQDAKDGDVLVNGSNIFIFHFINDTRLMGYCHVNLDDGRFYDDIGKNECFCLIDAVVTPATKEQRDTLMKAMVDAGYTFDFEKKELKEIEEEVNGEDYGIDGLWHAQRILEKTFGKVDGYQTDDGILSHKCAITAVKKLYEQKPEENKGNIGGISAEWSKDDEAHVNSLLKRLEGLCRKEFATTRFAISEDKEWLKSLRPQNKWKPTDEQMGCLSDAIEHYNSLGYPAQKLKELLDDLKKIKEGNV